MAAVDKSFEQAFNFKIRLSGKLRGGGGGMAIYYTNSSNLVKIIRVPPYFLFKFNSQ